MCNYHVPNIIPDNIKYIFIFESPHNSEVNNQIPISGSSGKHIMDVIFGIHANSFGIFIKNHTNNVAIINISPYPLQKLKNDNRDIQTIKNLVFVRKNYKSLLNHKNEKINQIENDLLNNFKLELDKIRQSNTTIIVCGRFAKTYCDEINLKYKLYMPHPSRNGWRNLNQKQKMFLDEFKQYYILQQLNTLYNSLFTLYCRFAQYF